MTKFRVYYFEVRKKVVKFQVVEPQYTQIHRYKKVDI